MIGEGNYLGMGSKEWPGASYPRRGGEVRRGVRAVRDRDRDGRGRRRRALPHGRASRGTSRGRGTVAEEQGRGRHDVVLPRHGRRSGGGSGRGRGSEGARSTAALATVAMPLHREMAILPIPPRRIFFHFHKPVLFCFPINSFKSSSISRIYLRH